MINNNLNNAIYFANPGTLVTLAKGYNIELEGKVYVVGRYDSIDNTYNLIPYGHSFHVKTGVNPFNLDYYNQYSIGDIVQMNKNYGPYCIGMLCEIVSIEGMFYSEIKSLSFKNKKQLPCRIHNGNFHMYHKFDTSKLFNSNN